MTTEQKLERALELLEDLALSGMDDWGGSWVNLQVDKKSVEEARAFLNEIKEPKQ